MSTPPPAPPTGYATGDIVGEKYRIERILGQGGMGTVYLAMHTELDEPVALKVLLPSVAKNNEAVSRFLREAKASVRIKGEHVARVLDAGRAGDTPFMVMEYLEGIDLGTLIEQSGAQPIDTAVEYILQAADAVAQAHAMGIVHRDLKPQNLFLTKRPDGSALIKVLDFGISKAEILGNATFGTTNDGALLGSPSYMSPEQIRSAKDVSTKADLWSLGVILFELLTARTPFDADTVHGLLMAITIAEPVPVRSLRAEVPDHLVDALDRCLCKVPEGRPADVGELARLIAVRGGVSQQLRAERVIATLQAVAADRASASQRIGALPTAAVPTMPFASAEAQNTVLLSDVKATTPIPSVSSDHPLATKLGAAEARLAGVLRPTGITPRVFVGVLGGLVAGLVFALALTRGKDSTTGDAATLASATATGGRHGPVVVAEPTAATTAAPSSGTPAGKGAAKPKSTTAPKSDDTPAPIRKVERGMQNAGRFLDCQIAGNCK